jgi:hypothetical protein
MSSLLQKLRELFKAKKLDATSSDEPAPAQPEAAAPPPIKDFFADDNAYFHADKHVSKKDEDDFDRYPFAAKLARLIAGHQSPYGLVVSVYGEWGEGKSSFLDFIESATSLLAEQQPEQFKTTIIKFNPWRFSTEDQLLMSFFAELWAALRVERTVDRDSESVREKIFTYAQVLGARRSAGIISDEFANEEMARFEALGSLETLKADINRVIKKAGTKLLIIIDDSDRLNNEEVENTLRLVKLTADFCNTTYLIGLNHKMVAEAIGQRYPGSTAEAGAQFLEKIVQVPLHLPPIQPTQLRRYLQARLDEVLSRTGTPDRLPDEEKARCYNALEESILILNPNPRSIYRLANVLLVAIPLLEDEANLTDIILIEALRIFYSKVYELVKDNERTFTGESRDSNDQFESEAMHKVLGEKREHAGKSLSLLANLFPRIDSFYYGNSIYGSLHPRRKRSQEELNHTRSIASNYYFKRYFYYAIQEGTIPEQTFKLFLKEMSSGHINEAYVQAIDMIKTSGDEEFFRRLENRIALNKQEPGEQLSLWQPTLLSTEEAGRYCELLLRLSGYLSSHVVSDRAIRLVSRSSELLLHYLILLPEQAATDMVERIIRKSSSMDLPLELMVDLHNIRRRRNDSGEMKQVRALFTDVPYARLARVLIDHLQEKARHSNRPWYDLYPYRTQHLIRIWIAGYGKKSLMNSLKPVLNADAENIAGFLRTVSPIATSGRMVLFTHMEKGTYEFLEDTVDVEFLYKIASYVVAGEPPVTYVESDFSEPEPHERVRQFIYWYDRIKKERRDQKNEQAMNQIRGEMIEGEESETFPF